MVRKTRSAVTAAAEKAAATSLLLLQSDTLSNGYQENNPTLN